MRLDDIERQLADLDARFAVVERRVTEQRGMIFRGPWRDGEPYAVGDAVARSGSTWIAVRPAGPSDIPGLPGEDSDTSPWRLSCKRGKDGTVPPEWERRLRALERRLSS